MTDVLYEKWPLPVEFPVTIASAEAEKHTYETHVGKSGIKWYVTNDVDNQADHIYCTDSDDWDMVGQGFGGRSILMTLSDGTEEELHGGWHSNAEAFFQDTAIDIRDRHRTFVVIAQRRDAEYLYDVVYADKEPQVTEFR